MASGAVAVPATPELSRAEAREVLKAARNLRRSGGDAIAAADDRAARAGAGYEQARDEVVGRQLAEMPLTRLKDTTAGGVRFGVLEKAGYRTVGHVLRTPPHRLMSIHGVGDHSVQQVIAAARQLELAMKQETHVRFELDRRPDQQTRLLEALGAHEIAARAVEPLRDQLEPLLDSLETLEKSAERTASGLRMFFSRRRRRDEVRSALLELQALVESERAREMVEQVNAALRALEQKKPKPAKDVWGDYEQRVASYNGLLVTVGGLTPDESAAEGFIPGDLARRVHEHPLDTTLLSESLSLRGYQAFGAKFALTQRRAILGDEMGLGKTIEALAAISHLRARGSTHFMVVCPASVLINWLHETDRHTQLDAFRLHGADRDTNVRLWERRGGIGVTTFGHLDWLESCRPTIRPAMLIIDEAHYVKNPQALRTLYVQDWVARAEHALFLTGTPMENRVDEFRTLVRHLQPMVANSVSAVDGLAGASRFRTAVAPVYLRRNQDDVLQELPPRINTEEWVEFGAEDLASYRAAVAERNFMAMRQAAYAPGTPHGSAKLARLVEIVEEAMSNGRKIVVFSFFRSVLDTIAATLGEAARGPLTGSVVPTKRQQLVDDFSNTRHPAVLVSQIEAGGVGLNIQAASVVILAEPQWKPSTEEQAIARSHRMGQARPVDVHRLLSQDGVDHHMLQTLATKAALFDEYVRRSALKDLSPDAIDISDVAETQKVASIVAEERRIMEIERRRLGLPADPEDGTGDKTFSRRIGLE